MSQPTVGEMIRQGTQDRGLTQAQAAQELECSKQTFSHWTRGYTIPALDRVGRIAEFTRRPVGEVIEAILRDHGFDADLEAVEAIPGYLNQPSLFAAA